MAYERKSTLALVLTLICICLLIHLDVVVSTSFTVGDSVGWSFSVQNWPNGKSFNAGDVLVFNYNPNMHNVVVVDEAGFNSCNSAPGSKVFNSGNDMITLPKGQSFYICGIPGHCDAGMKMAVNAA